MTDESLTDRVSDATLKAALSATTFDERRAALLRVAAEAFDIGYDAALDTFAEVFEREGRNAEAAVIRSAKKRPK